MKILVAEDEPMTLRILSFKLKEDGHEVILAEDGRMAMEYLEKEGCPDLVITDIMMPFVSGHEIIKKIRNELFSQIPIIIITAMGQAPSVTVALELGADDYIIKPFTIEELSLRVRLIKHFR